MSRVPAGRSASFMRAINGCGSRWCSTAMATMQSNDWPRSRNSRGPRRSCTRPRAECADSLGRARSSRRRRRSPGSRDRGARGIAWPRRCRTRGPGPARCAAHFRAATPRGARARTLPSRRSNGLRCDRSPRQPLVSSSLPSCAAAPARWRGPRVRQNGSHRTARESSAGRSFRRPAELTTTSRATGCGGAGATR